MRRLLGPPHDGELALNRRGRPTVAPARSPTVSAAYRRLEWRRIPWSVHDGSCESLVAPHGGIPAKAWHGPRHPLRLLACGAPSGSRFRPGERLLPGEGKYSLLPRAPSSGHIRTPCIAAPQPTCSSAKCAGDIAFRRIEEQNLVMDLLQEIQQ